MFSGLAVTLANASVRARSCDFLWEPELLWELSRPLRGAGSPSEHQEVSAGGASRCMQGNFSPAMTGGGGVRIRRRLRVLVFERTLHFEQRGK